MSTTVTAASHSLQTIPAFADDPFRTRSGDGGLSTDCACNGIVAAFESVQEPRRRRAASGDDIIECIDTGDSEQEPATMVQRTAVNNDRKSA
ncbi:MAG TPA: hypothetical protein VL522_20515 [Bordetella sp.]|nr:hypothetical protein [Bordetella sp.]